MVLKLYHDNSAQNHETDFFKIKRLHGNAHKQFKKIGSDSKSIQDLMKRVSKIICLNLGENVMGVNLKQVAQIRHSYRLRPFKITYR